MVCLTVLYLRLIWQSLYLPMDRGVSMSDLELGKISHSAGYPQQQHTKTNHNDAIQDSLDGALHRYEPVNEPKQHSNYGDDDDNGD